ncbi:hypothetical protein [Lentibacillus juripiscarius]|uniref:DUF4878 domain-containing protein n=1 Tax=Lentibacillus juripiscarius TaxID=257446 RepID=A0ABW5V562_9BACI
MRNVVLIVMAAGLGVTIYLFLYTSPEERAAEVVETFYTYEQDGAFSDSWAMFHPFMQEKFPKGHYLQDRAHVFMNHFGVTTFSFTVGEAVEMNNWKPAKEAEPMDEVYKVPVSQMYKGKYGNFTLVQNVFVTEVDGEWKVLWDYKKG